MMLFVIKYVQQYAPPQSSSVLPAWRAPGSAI